MNLCETLEPEVSFHFQYSWLDRNEQVELYYSINDKTSLSNFTSLFNIALASSWELGLQIRYIRPAFGTS